MTASERIAARIIQQWNGSYFQEFFFSAKKLQTLIAEAIDRKERKEFMSEARETAKKVLKNWSAEFGVTGLYPDSLAEAIAEAFTAALEAKDREIERMLERLSNSNADRDAIIEMLRNQRDEAVRLLDAMTYGGEITRHKHFIEARDFIARVKGSKS